MDQANQDETSEPVRTFTAGPGGSHINPLNMVALPGGGVLVINRGYDESAGQTLSVTRVTEAGHLDPRFGHSGTAQFEWPTNFSAQVAGVTGSGKVVIGGGYATVSESVIVIDPDRPVGDGMFTQHWITNEGLAVGENGAYTLQRAGTSAWEVSDPAEYIISRLDELGRPDPEFGDGGRLVVPFAPPDNFVVQPGPDGTLGDGWRQIHEAPDGSLIITTRSYSDELLRWFRRDQDRPIDRAAVTGVREWRVRISAKTGLKGRILFG